jgi:hypothetical protein
MGLWNSLAMRWGSGNGMEFVNAMVLCFQPGCSLPLELMQDFLNQSRQIDCHCHTPRGCSNGSDLFSSPGGLAASHFFSVTFLFVRLQAAVNLVCMHLTKLIFTRPP